MNGKVLYGLSHLNASAKIRECVDAPHMELIVLRRADALDEMAIRPTDVTISRSQTEPSSVSGAGGGEQQSATAGVGAKLINITMLSTTTDVQVTDPKAHIGKNIRKRKYSEVGVMIMCICSNQRSTMN